jgi:ribosomal protein S18 acetylase RimI-like enzyme
MLRLAAADMLGDDVAGAELWLSLTEPPGGQPWRFEHIGGDLEERHMWGVVIEWRGENVHLVYGDYGGSFSGIVKPDLTSEEDEIDFPDDEDEEDRRRRLLKPTEESGTRD